MCLEHVHNRCRGRCLCAPPRQNHTSPSVINFDTFTPGCVRTCVHTHADSRKGRTSTYQNDKTALFHVLALTDAGAIHYSGSFGCYQNNTIFLPIDLYSIYAASIQMALRYHVKVCFVKAKKCLQNINVCFFSDLILRFECSKHPSIHVLSCLFIAGPLYAHSHPQTIYSCQSVQMCTGTT